MSEELAQLYHHVCTVNHETPSRVLLDHSKLGHNLETGKRSEEGGAPVIVGVGVGTYLPAPTPYMVTKYKRIT